MLKCDKYKVFSLRKINRRNRLDWFVLHNLKHFWKECLKRLELSAVAKRKKNFKTAANFSAPRRLIKIRLADWHFVWQAFSHQTFGWQTLGDINMTDKHLANWHFVWQAFRQQTFGWQTFGWQIFVWQASSQQTFGRQTFDWQTFGW